MELSGGETRIPKTEHPKRRHSKDIHDHRHWNTQTDQQYSLPPELQTDVRHERTQRHKGHQHPHAGAGFRNVQRNRFQGCTASVITVGEERDRVSGEIDIHAHKQQQEEATPSTDVLQALRDDVEDSVGVGGAEYHEVGDREPEQAHRTPTENGEHGSEDRDPNSDGTSVVVNHQPLRPNAGHRG